MAITARPTARIRLGVDDTGVSQGLQNTLNHWGRFAVGLNQSLELVGKAFGAVSAVVGRFSGLIGQSITLAEIQVEAERGVVETLKQRGRYSRELFDQLQRENGARQQLTAVGDEAQLQMQKQALLLGVEAEHLGKVTEAVIALSEVKKVEQSEAMLKIARLYNGEVNALSELGIKVTSVKEGFARLSEMYQLATQRTETFAGKTELVRGNFGDLLEIIGRKIIENPVILGFLDDLNAHLLKAGEWVTEHGPKVQKFITDLVTDTYDLGKWIVDHRSEILLLTELFVAIKAAAAVGGAATALKGMAGAFAGTTLGTAAASTAKAGATLAAPLMVPAALGTLGTGGALLLIPRTDSEAWAAGIAASIPGTPEFAAANRAPPRLVGVRRADQPMAVDFTEDVGDGSVIVGRPRRGARRETDPLEGLSWAARDVLHQATRQMDDIIADEKLVSKALENLANAAAPSVEVIVKTSEELDTLGDSMSNLASMGVQAANAAAAAIGGTLAQAFTDLFTGASGEALAFNEVIGNLIMSIGQMLVQMGVAAVVLGGLATLSPAFGALLGVPNGPALAAAGGIATAAGVVMIGVGAALGGGGSRSSGAGPSTGGGGGGSAGFGGYDPAFGTSRLDRRTRFGEEGAVTYNVYFNQPVTEPARTARHLADWVDRGRSLRPAGGWGR